MKLQSHMVPSLFWSMLAAATAAAQTQNFPVKPIRVVTGLPGGGSDLVARLMLPGVTENLGQPVIVENRSGGMIPLEIVQKAQPDGYTLLVYSNGLWLIPFMQTSASYDPVRDFAPVSLVTNSPNILVVHPSMTASSVKELIALAKAKPGALNASTAANGSSSHLAFELFKSMSGVDIVRIPYKGNVPAVTDLIGGRVQLSFATPAAVTPQVKAGKLKALAVTSLEPYSQFPALPTVAASGLPGYESGTINGVFAPGKTPTPVINRLHQAIVHALNRPEVRNTLLETGILVVGSTPRELGAKVKSEMSRLGKVIKDAGIREN